VICFSTKASGSKTRESNFGSHFKGDDRKSLGKFSPHNQVCGLVQNGSREIDFFESSRLPTSSYGGRPNHWFCKWGKLTVDIFEPFLFGIINNRFR
jgi:hypothetical protein